MNTGQFAIIVVLQIIVIAMLWGVRSDLATTISVARNIDDTTVGTFNMIYQHQR